jgi:hypothetical protein
VPLRRTELERSRLQSLRQYPSGDIRCADIRFSVRTEDGILPGTEEKKAVISEAGRSWIEAAKRVGNGERDGILCPKRGILFWSVMILPPPHKILLRIVSAAEGL